MFKVVTRNVTTFEVIDSTPARYEDREAARRMAAQFAHQLSRGMEDHTSPSVAEYLAHPGYDSITVRKANTNERVTIWAERG